MKILFLFLFPLWAFSAEDPVHIIPEPAQLTQREGVFKINSSVRILLSATDSAFKQITANFAEELFNSTGIRFVIAQSDTASGNSIFITQGTGIASEGYKMDITPAKITISATDAAGLFYAFQSFRQLLPAAFNARKKIKTDLPWKLPCLSITDYPRYHYRGMHLDVSRHFFSVDYLKKYLDILAFYKINTFHWHLTDSHGWRLEIKQYPKLTSVGAWRADRTDIPFTIAPPTGKSEPAKYGGFYTQEQVKELVQYAKERYINIIPEIEMPGHCTAALVAYPQYTCLNNPVPLLIPCGYPGDLKHNFCPGNDSTFIFLQHILDEVMELFPSEYIHIGGDEVKPASWLNCPRCQKRMKEQNISTGKQLQSYFTHRIDDYINSKNRRLIGWDEIMEAGISQNAAVMSWRGNEGGIAAAKDSHAVVMAPYRYVYFDFYQSNPSLETDISYAGLSVEKVYSFDPDPEELTAKERNYILGAQACLWTENVTSPARVEYMLLPRMLALSEVLWTPASNKDYRRFIDKMEEHFKILGSRSVNYARSVYNVSIDPVYDSSKNSVSVNLNTQTAGKYIIRYCISGSNPSTADPVYTGPIAIAGSTHIKAGLFDQDQLLGKISSDEISVHKALGSHILVSRTQDEKQDDSSFKRLADGIHGSIEPYDGRWVSFQDSLISITADLKDKKNVSSFRFRCLEDLVGNALLPEKISVAISVDGNNFEEIYAVSNKKIPAQKTRHVAEYKKEGINREARFLKLTIHSSRKTNPENPSPNAVFIDEVVVE